MSADNFDNDINKLVQALALTLARLLMRLSCWALAQHTLCTSAQDRQLLNSNEHAFFLDGSRHVDEWVCYVMWHGAWHAHSTVASIRQGLRCGLHLTLLGT